MPTETRLVKVCPFCGGSNQEVHEIASSFSFDLDPVYQVQCMSCGTDGPVENNEEDAINSWNTRRG